MAIRWWPWISPNKLEAIGRQKGQDIPTGLSKLNAAESLALMHLGQMHTEGVFNKLNPKNLSISASRYLVRDRNNILTSENFNLIIHTY
jgi:hypothetical protein